MPKHDHYYKEVVGWFAVGEKRPDSLAGNGIARDQQDGLTPKVTPFLGPRGERTVLGG